MFHTSDLGFGHTLFSWSSSSSSSPPSPDESQAPTPSTRSFSLRIDPDVIFKKHTLNIIVGPTGSGKTSVLMALLREMHYVPLGLDSWVNLPKTGGVAYAAQESWVLNDTIKGNILFGAPFDEERYSQGMVLW